MSGKLIGIFLVGTGLLAGALIYYLQIYAYYQDVDLETVDLRLVSVATGEPDFIIVNDLAAIDADSSPLRFRACFTTPSSLAALTEDFVIYEAAEPLTGPGWFDCYDAAEVGAALEQGRAIAFLSRADIRDGVDRVVAVFDDGRAFAWHQLNDTYKD